LINIEHLTITKNAFGEEIWSCTHCGRPADSAKGIQNNPDQTALLLVCPSSGTVLGEWATADEKKIELTEYLSKLKRPST
jgi:hypothetical protein